MKAKCFAAELDRLVLWIMFGVWTVRSVPYSWLLSRWNCCTCH